MGDPFTAHMDKDHLYRWPILTNELLQVNTPSQRDGWSASQETYIRKKAGRVVFDTAKAYGVSSGTSTVAVTMFLRFYCRMSMAKNHPFVIALASLFLACKVNDNPRSLRRLQFEMLKQWYGRDSPELRERLEEQEKMDKLFETAVNAETLLLMTLDFDLNIDVLLSTILKVIKQVPDLKGLMNVEVQQKLVNVCNDIMRTDGTLVLVHSNEKLAVAICHIFCQRKKSLTIPPNNPDGSNWYERFGLTVQEFNEINDRFIRMYKKISKEKSKTVSTTGSPADLIGRVTHSRNGSRDGSRAGSRAGSRVGSPSKLSPMKRQRSMDPDMTGTEVALQDVFQSQVGGVPSQQAIWSATMSQNNDFDDANTNTGGADKVQRTNDAPPSSPEEGEIEEGEIR
jgi:hypothetical protein